jgi:O-antigen ligase
MSVALPSGSVGPSKGRELAVVCVAAAGAAVAGEVSRFLPLQIVAAGALGGAVILLISLNPMRALMFLALARASLEGLQSQVIAKPGGVSISPTDVLSLAFLGGAGLWLYSQARAGNQFWRHPIVPWAFLLLGLSTMTLVYSPSASLGARDLVKWSGTFCGFLVLLAVRPDPRRLRLLLLLIVAGSIVPLGIGGWQFLNSVGRLNAYHGGLRVQASFIHPNDYGAYLVSIAVAILGVRPLTAGWQRKAVDLIGLGVFISIVLTLSRSSWVGLGVVVLVFGWKYRKMLLWSALGVAGVGVVVPRILGRATDLFHSTTKETTITGQAKAGNSLQARFSIWSNEIQAWKKRPFLGHGWGYTYSKQSHGSHNDYLRMLVEGGIVGLIAFVVLMLTILRESARAAKGRTDLPLAFFGLSLAYAVQAAGTNAFAKDTYQLYFWLLAGISFVWAETVPPSAAVWREARQSTVPDAATT